MKQISESGRLNQNKERKRVPFMENPTNKRNQTRHLFVHDKGNKLSKNKINTYVTYLKE